MQDFRQAQYGPGDAIENLLALLVTTGGNRGSADRRREDNDESYVSPGDMLRELMADNKTVVAAMRECHELCDKPGDVATASILENFIDQAERRLWFLFEASRKADGSGH